jgi:hypothetical protein
MHELCTDFKKAYDAVRSVILLGASAILRKGSARFLISVYLSVRVRELDWSSSKLIFERLLKLCREN